MQGARNIALGLFFTGCITLLLACGCGTPAPPTTDGKPEPPPAAEAETKARLTAQPLSEELLQQGWISLFDGQTFFGWQKDKTKGDWKIEDGQIVVSSGPQELLCTTTRFGDYQLRVEYRASAETNSGLFLRTGVNPTDPAADCYELNIAPPDNPFPTGSLVARQKTEVEIKEGDWNTLDVTVQGGKISVLHNGVAVLEYTDEKPLPAGFIGLQHNSGEVAFRKILLKPQSMQPLPVGDDKVWKQYPDMEGEFTTEDDILRVKNGPGQLETVQQAGDFVLQLEYKTHAENLNSGVFFRCIPGEKTNGYESQIHNGRKNNDPLQPLDCGTGGIFRRQDARIVMGQDKQWVHKTLIADGPHMAAWVNGFQVSDWTDDRKPDENPRRGIRLKPGTFMLQAHDPTTDISFRNFRLNVSR